MSYSITRDDYYTRNQPAKSEELKNRVLVKYAPLVHDPDSEVYRSPTPISLAAGASTVVSASYSTVTTIAATGGIDNMDGSTFEITAESYIAGGASVTVKNTGATPGKCELYIYAASVEVYRGDEAISLPAGDSVTVEVEYQTVPSIDAVVAVDNITGSTFSVSASYSSWGAVVTVTNTGGAPGTCQLFINALPLIVAGQNYAPPVEDAASIAENGVLEYKFPDNQLIQTADNAAAITAALITSYATARKDVSITWRGDPALELGDEITVPIYHRPPAAAILGDFYIFKNKLDFDGTVKMQTEGRVL